MVTGLGTIFMNPGVKRRIATAMLRKSCRHHDRIFFQNVEDRDDLLRAGVVEDRSKVVMTAGSGVDLDLFPVRPLPDRPVFLMLARLLVAKGVREYLEAARLLRKSCPDAVVRLAGMEDPGSGGVPMGEVSVPRRDEKEDRRRPHGGGGSASHHHPKARLRSLGFRLVGRELGRD